MFKTKVAKVKVLNLQGGFFYGILFCSLFGFIFYIYHTNASEHTPLFIASLLFYFLCITFMEIALVGELCATQQKDIEQLRQEITNLKQKLKKIEDEKDQNSK